MKNVYGRKTRPALQADFFNGTPETRRSPRLRKVLEERSSNIQQLQSSPPPLSPCASKVKPVVSIETLESSPEADEPVKRATRRKNAQQTKEDLDESDALAKALNLLDLEDEEDKPIPKKHQPCVPVSSTKVVRKGTLTEETADLPIQQHPLKLKPEIRSYVEPLLECKNISKVVESFDGWLSQRLDTLSFSKIGEGSYGQVFRVSNKHGNSEETAIIKLMPLNAARGRRWQQFTSIESAATEVQLLAKMQKVPGYVEFRGACVLQGAMPDPFVKLWEEYRDSGRTVESRDPRLKGTYPSTQLWLLLEMADAGSNLEPGRYMPPEAKTSTNKGKFVSVERIWDIFWQVVLAVAKAEKYCQFEHRDLHLGNICVQDLPPPSASEIKKWAKKSILPLSTSSTGTTVTIIDYTLSRANNTSTEAVAFDFQADEVLLSGEGDLQYDMYRWMDEIIGDRGSKTYDPRTNVVWFYHLIVKLLDMMIPLGGNQDSSDLGEDSEIFRSETEDQARLRILEDVRCLTDPKSIRTWLANSAGDLLQHAFAKDWIAADSI